MDVLKSSITMRNFMESSTELAIGDLFKKAKQVITMREKLDEMIHPQPETPVQIDNYCTNVLLNDISRPGGSHTYDT